MVLKHRPVLKPLLITHSRTGDLCNKSRRRCSEKFTLPSGSPSQGKMKIQKSQNLLRVLSSNQPEIPPEINPAARAAEFTHTERQR